MPEAGSGEPQVSSLVKISIVEQIEYYFGDFNMMKDKFLKAEVQKNEGWIPIKTLLRFNRLAALTKDESVVLSAFKDNPSELVMVNAETKCLRRNPTREIPEPGENWRTFVADRTIYVKGFPLDTTTLDDILKFMQTFGKIDNVYKRSYYDKALKEWKFKGSVFVTFPTREDADSFLGIKSVKFAGNELIRKWQLDYIEEKKNERIQSKLQAKEAKEKLLKDQVQSELKSDQKLPTGALILLQGLKENISVNALKKKLMEDFKWSVGFVDHTVGESNAYVRLQEENSAKDALSKLTDNSFEFEGVTVKAEPVEGEKEVELLQKMEADKNSRVLQKFMNTKNKGGKRNKGGFRQRGRRGHDNDKSDVTDSASKKDAAATEKAAAATEKDAKDAAATEKAVAPTEAAAAATEKATEAGKKDEAAASGTSNNASGSPTLKRKKEDTVDDENASKKTKADA